MIAISAQLAIIINVTRQKEKILSHFLIDKLKYDKVL